MPRIRHQLSNGSVEKIVDTVVTYRNNNRGTASGWRSSLLLSIRIFATHNSNAARKAVTAPLVAMGAQSTNRMKQKNRAASSQRSRPITHGRIFPRLNSSAGEGTTAPKSWAARDLPTAICPRCIARAVREWPYLAYGTIFAIL